MRKGTHQWASGTHVVGGLAEVTEGRDGKGEGAVDVLGQLLGGAVRLGDVGGERGRHVEFVVLGLRMSLYVEKNELTWV